MPSWRREQAHALGMPQALSGCLYFSFFLLFERRACWTPTMPKPWRWEKMRAGSRSAQSWPCRLWTHYMPCCRHGAPKSAQRRLQLLRLRLRERLHTSRELGGKMPERGKRQGRGRLVQMRQGSIQWARCMLQQRKSIRMANDRLLSVMRALAKQGAINQERKRGIEGAQAIRTGVREGRSSLLELSNPCDGKADNEKKCINLNFKTVSEQPSHPAGNAFIILHSFISICGLEPH